MDNNIEQQDSITELVLRFEREQGHRISDYTKLLTIDGIMQLHQAATSYAESGCRNQWARGAVQNITIRLFKVVVTIAHLVEWDKEENAIHRPVIDCLNDIANASLASYVNHEESMKRIYGSGRRYEGD